MPQKKVHLIQDLFFVTLSVIFAIFIQKSGIAHELISSSAGAGWLGVFIAGTFFTSVFTTAPAIIILGQFATIMPLAPLVLVGGLGAMVGDYIIFRLVKDRFSGDLSYLLSFAKPQRLPKIFKTKLFRSFVPLVGALIIASPLPDELGIAILGISRVSNKIFLAASFVMNCLGILLIGLIARAVAGN